MASIFIPRVPRGGQQPHFKLLNFTGLDTLEFSFMTHVKESNRSQRGKAPMKIRSDGLA